MRRCFAGRDLVILSVRSAGFAAIECRRTGIFADAFGSRRGMAPNGSDPRASLPPKHRGPRRRLGLAFRNVLRQRRRSFVGILSVGFGVVALILAAGFIEWIYWAMREDTIRTGLGHIQVVAQGLPRQRARRSVRVRDPRAGRGARRAREMARREDRCRRGSRSAGSSSLGDNDHLVHRRGDGPGARRRSRRLGR